MTASGHAHPDLVVCGDWDSGDRCGVAHSERALLAHASLTATVVNPSEVLRSVRAVWGERRRDGPVLLVFPTRSTVRRWRPLLTFLVTALLRRGDDLRVHLHEYRIFREVRWALNLVLLVGRPTVVVSSRSEELCMKRSLAGRLGRVRPQVIPPFGTLTPSATRGTAIGAAGSGIVGVFGFAGPAKGTELVARVVRALPPHYHRLELVGTGWHAVTWPRDILDRVRVATLGFVPSEDLGPVFEHWELAVAPLSGGASDGRLSLRTPLAHGTPTVTEPGRSDDLTLRPGHLVLVEDDPERAIAGAVATASDREARRRGATEVDDFEQRTRRALRVALLGSMEDQLVSTLAPPGAE